MKHIKNSRFKNLKEIREILNQMSKDLELTDLDIKNNIKELAARTISINHDGVKSPNYNSDIDNKLDIDVNIVEKHFSLLDDLSNKLDTLNNVESALLYQFGKDKTASALIKQTKETKKLVESELKNIQKVLSNLAKTNIPKNFKKLVTDLYKHITEEADGWYTKASKSMLIDTLDPTDENRMFGVRYTTYLTLQDFTDDSYFVYRQYNIICTCIIQDGETNYYLNTLPTYRLPGKFHYGNKFADLKQAQNLLSDILVSEGFIDMIQNLPIPLKNVDLKSEKFGIVVKKAQISDKKCLRLTLLPTVTEDTIDQVAINLWKKVNGLFASLNLPGRTKYKIGKKGKVYYVDFYYNIADSSKVQLDRSQLNTLKHELDLTDEQVTLIMQNVL